MYFFSIRKLAVALKIPLYASHSGHASITIVSCTPSHFFLPYRPFFNNTVLINPSSASSLLIIRYHTFKTFSIQRYYPKPYVHLLYLCSPILSCDSCSLTPRVVFPSHLFILHSFAPTNSFLITLSSLFLPCPLSFHLNFLHPFHLHHCYLRRFALCFIFVHFFSSNYVSFPFSSACTAFTCTAILLPSRQLLFIFPSRVSITLQIFD